LRVDWGAVDWDEDLVTDAGFDSWDEEVSVGRLAESWGCHPVGSIIVSAQTTEGASLRIQVTAGD